MQKTIVGATLAGALALAGVAQARDWPTGPVTMVVPFSAGGTTDVLGRIMALRIGEILGQPVVVENVGGAGGMRGSLRVARAQPDGSQFLFSGLGPLVLNPALHKKPAYRPGCSLCARDHPAGSARPRPAPTLSPRHPLLEGGYS